MTVVLDASAVLAILNGEPGAASAGRFLSTGALISSVNFAEVVGYYWRRGRGTRAVEELVALSPLVVVEFDVNDARLVGELEPFCRPYGLSLADRACLALAIRSEAPAVTADRQWARLRDAVPCPVQLIR